VGVADLCWVMWTSRNNMVFDKSLAKTYMQVFYRGTYWIHQWAQLQRYKKNAVEIMEVCRVLESTVMQIFASHGWRFCNRITAS
jgi:hypothetical protein